MDEQNEQFSAGRALCNEIGGAAMTLMAEKKEITPQSMLELIQAALASDYDYGNDRRQAMQWSVNLLKKFV